MNVIDLTKPNMIRYPKGGDVMEIWIYESGTKKNLGPAYGIKRRSGIVDAVNWNTGQLYIGIHLEGVDPQRGLMEKTKPKDESLEIELEIGYLLELPEMSYDQMDRYETLVVDYPEVHKRIHKEVRGK